METSDLYEVEQLSLFGDQLSFGFGSPTEPDSPVYSPGVGFDSNQLGLLVTEQLADKPKTGDNSPIIELGQHPVHGSPSGLEVGWMDTQYDIVNLLEEPKATSPAAECSEVTADASPSSLAVEDIPIVNVVNTDVAWPSAEGGTLQVDSNENVEEGIEVDLLSEAFNLLDKAGISVDDIVQFKQFLDTEAGQCETLVTSDTSDLLLTGSDAGSTDSGLESLPSSSPQSPGYNLQLSETPATTQSEQPRSKSRRGRRMAPYNSKLPADRKERKKIQNKTAALKYRQKKKEETKKVFTEVEILEAKNKELKNKVESITQEINYLKDLMGEILRAKLVNV